MKFTPFISSRGSLNMCSDGQGLHDTHWRTESSEEILKLASSDFWIILPAFLKFTWVLRRVRELL